MSAIRVVKLYGRAPFRGIEFGAFVLTNVDKERFREVGVFDNFRSEMHDSVERAQLAMMVEHALEAGFGLERRDEPAVAIGRYLENGVVSIVEEGDEDEGK